MLLLLGGVNWGILSTCRTKGIRKATFWTTLNHADVHQYKPNDMGACAAMGTKATANTRKALVRIFWVRVFFRSLASQAFNYIIMLVMCVYAIVSLST